MNENKFDLKNIITVDNVKDSYSYKTSKGILKNFFGKQFETECRYSDKNDDEVDCYVFLTDGEYNCLNDLCRLLTINIEDYLPMRCSNNTRDIIYHCSENLPDRYFYYTDFNKLRGHIIQELTNRKLIQFNLDKKTFLQHLILKNRADFVQHFTLNKPNGFVLFVKSNDILVAQLRIIPISGETLG